MKITCKWFSMTLINHDQGISFDVCWHAPVWVAEVSEVGYLEPKSLPSGYHLRSLQRRARELAKRMVMETDQEHDIRFFRVTRDGTVIQQLPTERYYIARVVKSEIIKISI